ncbi:MAG: LysR family transcriptional regulator [Pseudomonadota bacterium]
MPLRRLPPLGSLRAFEAAARLSSFKAAAAELSVTPAAVSQRIRALEEELGTQLFTRAVRAVSLTEAGRQLQPALTSAFLEIRNAVDGVRPEAREPLRVEASAPVVAKWLLPRLHRFSERYADLGVSIQTGRRLRPCTDGQVLICFNEAPGEDVFALRLCSEHVLPLASPELVARLDLRQPEDIRRAPLLHDTSSELFPSDPSWACWFAAAGLNPVEARRGLRFDPHASDHAIDAAVNGAGVVLGRRLLARGDMLAGRLVSPFGPVLPMHASYFLVCKPGQERRPDIAAFFNWIFAEVAAFADGAPARGAAA